MSKAPAATLVAKRLEATLAAERFAEAEASLDFAIARVAALKALVSRSTTELAEAKAAEAAALAAFDTECAYSE